MNDRMPSGADQPEAQEAYALMWYACPCGHRERIWNARPGVTPFAMGCPSCGKPSLKHVDWHCDTRAEKHVPHFGQRIWINLTMERARELAARRVDQCAAAGIPYPEGMTREALIEQVAKSEYESFGVGTSPDGAVVHTNAIAREGFGGGASNG